MGFCLFRIWDVAATKIPGGKRASKMCSIAIAGKSLSLPSWVLQALWKIVLQLVKYLILGEKLKVKCYTQKNGRLTAEHITN